MAQPLPISTIVNVQISLQARGVTQTGFGIPLILGDTGFSNSDRIREYSTKDDVLNDFASSDPEYKAAAAIFSQSPSVEKVKIGVEDTRVAQVQTIVFSGNLVTGNTINGKVNGVAITAVPFNASNAQTLTDLATTLQATAAIVTSVSNGTNTITNTAANAGVPFTLTDFVVTGGASQATATIATTVDNHGVADDLAEISDVDNDWYALIWTERDAEQVQEAAKYIEASIKIFVTVSDDTDILDASSTTDIAYILGNANYKRTALIYNATVDDYADGAWVGIMLPFNPGAATWKFKVLDGITADNLTPSQVAAAKAKNCNVFVPLGGVDITLEGVMTGGLFVDLIIGIDWLQARMEERIYSQLVNLPKIPFTDRGIAIIKNQIWSVLRDGIDNDVIAEDPSPTVTAPKAVDVDPTDRANRLLTGVEFGARMAGAIHKVDIQGVVTI